MYGKFMVDSVKYWSSEYDLDGFRFDLMGLHDLDTMQQVENAVHTINPEAIIYGEGWTMGATIDGSKMANQSNIKDITVTDGAIGAVAVFNDVIRDGLKGSVFEKESQGYISGKGSANLAKVLFGIKGGDALSQGWSVKDARVVNYMSAHDNNTLWDKLELSNGSYPIETRLAMNRLGTTILMASKGMTFFQAGEERIN
jgi:pullulanase